MKSNTPANAPAFVPPPSVPPTIEGIETPPASLSCNVPERFPVIDIKLQRALRFVKMVKQLLEGLEYMTRIVWQ